MFCKANNWWLRSANSSTNFYNVNNNGNVNNNNASNSNGVVFGSSPTDKVTQVKSDMEGEKENMTDALNKSGIYTSTNLSGRCLHGGDWW